MQGAVSSYEEAISRDLARTPPAPPAPGPVPAFAATPSLGPAPATPAMCPTPTPCTLPYDLRLTPMSSDALLESRGGDWKASPADVVAANCIGLDSNSVIPTSRDAVDTVVRSLLQRPTELRAEISGLKVCVCVVHLDPPPPPTPSCTQSSREPPGCPPTPFGPLCLPNPSTLHHPSGSHCGV